MHVAVVKRSCKNIKEINCSQKHFSYKLLQFSKHKHYKEKLGSDYYRRLRSQTFQSFFFFFRPPPQFRGPPQQFDYQHQRPDFEPLVPPSMVNEYNHGRPHEEDEYGMEDYELPPNPPVPEPIIPTAMYYELPAGLMAPLVGVRKNEDTCARSFRQNVTGQLFSIETQGHFRSLELFAWSFGRKRGICFIVTNFKRNLKVLKDFVGFKHFYARVK